MTSNYKNLYKLIDGLNNKIKKLEINTNNIKKDSIIETFRINNPKEYLSNKKYIGLLFDNNINNFDSDNSSTGKNLNSFIKLRKANIIINYSIQLELTSTPLSSIICSLALGIKTKHDSKIKIIKGTKYLFDLISNQVIENKIIFTNTILYISDNNEELCLIADFGKNCIINNKKSILKILYL